MIQSDNNTLSKSAFCVAQCEHIPVPKGSVEVW